MPDDLLDTPAAAALLQVSTQTLMRWRQDGKVRAWKRVGRWFYSRQDLEELFVEGQPRPRPPVLAPARQEPAWVERELARHGLGGL